MVKLSAPSLFHPILHIGLISVFVALVFLPGLGGEFVNWDDATHVAENVAVQTFDIPQMFHQTVQKIYIPLTTLSFAVERKLFGVDPFIYHLDNLLLHILNSILVYVIARRLGLNARSAFAGALIFGIHPMRVESVAWVTERKDLLYAFFYLLSIRQYLSFIKQRNWRTFLGVFVLGILSLLAKPMALSLPLIFFLLDWFHRRNFSLKLVLEKIPFIILFIPITWMTYMLHARNPVKDGMDALLTWIWTFNFYIWKFIWPAVLVPVYHIPDPVSLSNPLYICSIIFFLLLLFGIFRFRNNRWWIFSMAFYVLSIFFLLRFDHAKDINIVADRFMYLPSFGFCLLIGLWVDSILRLTQTHKFLLKVLVQVALWSIAFLLGLKSIEQSKIWNNTVSLWTHVIRYNPTEFIAFNDRAVGYIHREMYDLALSDYGAILKFDPGNADAHFNRGMLFHKLGRYSSAIDDFDKVIAKYPYYEKAYNNRGKAYEAAGNDEMALADYTKTIKVNPAFPDGYMNRGNSFNHRGSLDQAIKDYQSVIELDSGNAKAVNNRGTVYAKLLQDDKALDDFNRAINLDPNYAEAYYNRSVIYHRRDQGVLALKDAFKSRMLGADVPESYILELQKFVR